LAKEVGKRQTAVNGGQTRVAVFNYFKTPPIVEVVVDVDPDPMALAALTQAHLSDQEDILKAGPSPCQPRPLPLSWQVPAGLYTLRLQPPDPNRPKQKIIAAHPPRWHEPVGLP
jgi:hypothetical protein